MPSELPVELIELVLGHLIQSHEFGDIYNASSVCRVWASVMRPWVFDFMEINPKNARSLARLISSPLCTIPRRVNTLRFCIPRKSVHVYAARHFTSYKDIMGYFQPKGICMMTLYILPGQQSKKRILTRSVDGPEILYRLCLLISSH